MEQRGPGGVEVWGVLQAGLAGVVMAGPLEGDAADRAERSRGNWHSLSAGATDVQSAGPGDEFAADVAVGGEEEIQQGSEKRFPVFLVHPFLPRSNSRSRHLSVSGNGAPPPDYLITLIDLISTRSSGTS
jgi:hypothetical protein